MSPSTKIDLGEPTPAGPGARRHRSRSGRVIAGTLVAGLAVAGLAVTASQSASAAAPPRAQSVGRFLDGAVGSNPIQDLADLQDARATAPGTQSVQNPLDATVLNALELPLTAALQLPGGGVSQLGAANQVAVADPNGRAYGASGAVSNSGGVSLGGNNSAFPADATIDLSSTALGSVGIPGLPTLPGLTGTGGTSLAALGGVNATIGAVRGVAETPVTGSALPAGHTPAKSSIATLELTIGSPALGALLTQVKSLLNPAILTGLLGPVVTLLGAELPPTCALNPGSVPTPISLEAGAIVIDPATANINVKIGPLLQTLLGKDISNLSTSNFDLVDFLVTKLPTILSQGLEKVVDGLITPLQAQFTACVSALGALAPAVVALLDALNTGKTTLLNALNGLANQLGAAGASGLTALAAGLKDVIDIGLNVQSGPATQTPDPTYPFTTKLNATPNQATPVVADQTLVRAIEINLLPAAGNSGVATIALGNAAAGPSTAAVVAPTTAASTGGAGVAAVNTNIPTGVPAGFAKPAGSPDLTLILLLVGLLMAGGGAVAWKFRGTHV